MTYRIYLINILLLIIIYFTSCDCFHQGSGIVLDSKTNKPLDSVYIEASLLNNKKSIFIEKMYTDSTGRFDIRTGFLVKDECKMGLVLLFSKPGYHNLMIKDPKDANICMTPNEHPVKYFDTLFINKKP